ncbi:MAG: hypothetical protein J7L69_08675 [Desulfobulbaceae bacterium]|nr:hypothetical protein [Desulfobulbaceae bacterium]
MTGIKNKKLVTAFETRTRRSRLALARYLPLRQGTYTRQASTEKSPKKSNAIFRFSGLVGLDGTDDKEVHKGLLFFI